MGLNKTLLIGRLGKDPVSKESDKGVMARFSFATSETYYDSEQNKKEKVEWHNIVAFGKRAEACLRYLKKGSRAYIEGKNATRSFKKEGQTHYITEVQLKEIQFLDNRD